VEGRKNGRKFRHKNVKERNKIWKERGRSDAKAEQGEVENKTKGQRISHKR
jgi:hypothetical protein